MKRIHVVGKKKHGKTQLIVARARSNSSAGVLVFPRGCFFAVESEG
jgi:hypothetical protein